jgi:GNAT superfamily N-acetyltransferase
MAKHLASAWSPGLQREEIDDPRLDTLLAIDGAGRFAGFAQLHAGRAPDCVATHNPVELKRFYVDRPWHGQGLARELMAAVERAARARSARELWLGVWERNERARAFYRKCGFRPVGKQVFVVGDDPQTDDVMIKELA